MNLPTLPPRLAALPPAEQQKGAVRFYLAWLSLYTGKKLTAISAELGLRPNTLAQYQFLGRVPDETAAKIEAAYGLPSALIRGA